MALAHSIELGLSGRYKPGRITCKPLPPKASDNRVMTIRTRKLFGAIALLLLAFAWSMMGMVLAQFPVIANSGMLQWIYYIVVGIGWVLPAMPIVSWMLRPDVRQPEA
jgi:Protein of unknown function (DUF2842)